MAIDLPGFGRTTVETGKPNPEDSIAFMSTLVYHFINMSFKKSVAKRFILVGFGTGAHVAAELAATYPELFTHALLCAPIGIFPTFKSGAFFHAHVPYQAIQKNDTEHRKIGSLSWALGVHAKPIGEMCMHCGGVVAEWILFAFAFLFGAFLYFPSHLPKLTQKRS